MIPQSLPLTGPLLAGIHNLCLELSSLVACLTCSSLCNSTLLVVCFSVPLCLLALEHCSPLNPLLCPFLLPHGQVESSLGHSWVSQISLALLLPMLSHISIINSPPPYLETVMSFSFPFYYSIFFQDDSRLWQFDSKISLVYSDFPFLFFIYFVSPLSSHTSPSPWLPTSALPPFLSTPPLFLFRKRQAWEQGDNKIWHIKLRKTKHLPLY